MPHSLPAAEPEPRSDDAIAFIVTEPRTPPITGLVLAYAAMIPIAAGALGVWLLPAGFRMLALDATILWAGTVLTFLSGVRRGLSFRTAGGATWAQIATMLWLFLLGLVALGAGMVMATQTALVSLLLGYLSLAVLDPIAARRGEAPLYFARLRPFQMAIPILALGGLLFLG